MSSEILVSDDHSTQSEISQPTPVLWTDDEQRLLEENIARLEISEKNLKMIFEISMLFPHKTVQQIIMRLKWNSQKNDITWESYCAQNIKSSPSCSPDISNHSSPRISKSKPNRKVPQPTPKKLDAEKRKRRSVPDSATISVAQSRNKNRFSLNQENSFGNSNFTITNGSSQTSSNYSYNTISGIHQVKGPRTLKHNRGSAMFMQVNPIEEVDESASLKSFQQTQPTVQPPVGEKMEEMSTINYPESDSPRFQKIETFQNIPTVPPVPLQGDTRCGVTGQELNLQDLILRIDGLVRDNNSILNYVESSINKNLQIDPNYLNAFGTNLQNLLELTDGIAKPSRLPFMPLTLNVPPSLIGQRPGTNFQQRYV
ncbi:hypothetical protein EIN_162180 [Entamoeba invadens IP1]|uniref:Uncharacterized protein n=1 Tax=Entamoeba invadens IP1 TaxID=370355 RepID=A0A0A1TYM0_ENTIV|nr:hypothetical protein EIN_162180 [Entamoeba invadens IP1]ELP86584.1 hypothetical protein EIN_162180 [Entamoeba invadens IP1]|eukprot:XP_004185930.1 hypothetical protein EIN_162180 [Entamoeba invadens IP1]